jgi:iron complex transport system substrate-binding protein
LDAATEVFENQVSRTKNVLDVEATDKSVAFFSINSNGQITVRKNGDYISSMIAMAGGNYVPGDILDSDDALSTVKISMEDFYVGAVDADVLIYNSTIEGEVGSIAQLTDKCGILADFKAVKDGNVWCTGKNLFQEPMGLGKLILDMHRVLTDENAPEELTYLHKLTDGGK